MGKRLGTLTLPVIAGDAASPSDGDMWYNSTTNKFRKRQNGTTYDFAVDSELSTSDITTNNVSTSKHGFAPKAPNDATKYLDGTGAYSVPAGAFVLTPGGRLTLESGVPISTTDQTGKTNIYYTPFVHNNITLWNGTIWQTITFTQYTLALGTLTNSKNYDVFAYLNSGALALEFLAWTNDTTRATSVTFQDGRYCKSTDKTRLLLGTIRTTSTTTTEDSVVKRFLFNTYNKVTRDLYSAPGYNSNGSSGSFTVTTVGGFEEANGGSGSRIEYVTDGFTVVDAFASAGYSFGDSLFMTIGNDGTPTRVVQGYSNSNPCLRVEVKASAGYHYLSFLMGASGGSNSVTINTDYGDWKFGTSGDIATTFLSATIMN